MKQLNSQVLILIFGLLFSHSAKGQYFFSQDCSGALSLCNGRYVFPYSFDGDGDIDELALIPTCLPQREGNSAWYKLAIDAPGFVAFSIEPFGPNDDYDFAMFDITGLTCADIRDTTAPLLRCSYSISSGVATGLSSTDTLTSAGENDEPFLFWLPVDSGDVIALMVTSSSPFSYGYALDLTSSTATIVSREPLLVADKFMAICKDYLYSELYFNQPIDSNSISANFSEFVLTDNTGGNLSITDVRFDSISNKLAIVAQKPNYVIDSVSVIYQPGTDGNTLKATCNAQYLPLGTDSFNYLFNNIGAGGFTATNIGTRFSMQANTVNVPFVRWYLNGTLAVRQQASLPLVSNFQAGQTYTVCMAAELGCNYDSTCQTFVFTDLPSLDAIDDIQLYPNPTNNLVTITAPFAIDKVEIVDLQGKVFLLSNMDGQSQTISTASLSNGLYVARIHTKQGIINKKLLVAR